MQSVKLGLVLSIGQKAKTESVSPQDIDDIVRQRIEFKRKASLDIAEMLAPNSLFSDFH